VSEVAKRLHVVAHALREGFVRVARLDVPHLHGHLRHHELALQLATSVAGSAARVALHQQQALRPAVQAVGDHHVLGAVPHHVHDAVLQRLDLLAQHLGLALLQAHRAVAVRAGQLHAGQQLGVALEEVGVFAR
jgi:hypothetical protein